MDIPTQDQTSSIGSVADVAAIEPIISEHGSNGEELNTPETTVVLIKEPSPVPVIEPDAKEPSPIQVDTQSASDAAVAETSELRPPLNVTDALTYLDNVKVQFAEEPEVYNNFLDIMKDFKSHTIDTPGVIQRVSQLFHGNPTLIQGFNTFLPPGYRIEMSLDPNRPNLITVTTPSGETVHDTNTFHLHTGGIANDNHSSLAVPAWSSVVASTPENRQELSNGDSATTQQARLLSELDPAVDQVAAEGQQHSQGLPIEQALEYLHKVQQRYPEDPEKYNSLLRILMSHHQAKRRLHDSPLVSQARELFKDAPDLFYELEQFLPGIADDENYPQSTTFVPDRPSRKVASTAPKRRKDNGSSAAVQVKRINPAAPVASRAKKPKLSHKTEHDSQNFSSFPGTLSPQLSQPQQQAPAQAQWSTNSQTAIPSPVLAPVRPHHHSSGSGAAEELQFFDRAKKILDSMDTYEEFLKLLRLYTMDIVDDGAFMDCVEMFIRDAELLQQFKVLLRWDGRDRGPPGSIRTAAPEALPAFQQNQPAGPSYRRLSDKEAHLACSGRDQLCRSLLNDEWVSHPTWASEDSGFVTHKKNVYEDYMHRVEEERHEYAVHVQGLAHTISLFDPILERISEMSQEESLAFRLEPDFGGPGCELYHRVIKKVYGRESGLEMIQALQDSPAIAVPIVLHTLMRTDEVWRRLGREWSRSWRDVDAKNFYKSLDHQGINFKANEKKAITAKAFVTEIEGESRRIRKSSKSPVWAAGCQGFHLQYEFVDKSVLYDAVKMVYSYLDSQSSYSPNERVAVESFLRSFVPMLCKTPASTFDHVCNVSKDDDMRTNGHTQGESNGMALDPKSPSSSSSKDESLPSAFPYEGSDGDSWIQESTSHTVSSTPSIPFFANTTLYTLVRLIHLLYSRLLSCKIAGARLALSSFASLAPNPIALDLGLDDPFGPVTTLSQAISSMNVSGESPHNIPYMYFLEACEKVFDSEMDQTTFEEHMRWLFGKQAYQVYTLDKLLPVLVKQVQVVQADNKCQELINIVEIARSLPIPTNQDIIRYRREAENHVGSDDHLYRIEWAADTLMIQLMDGDDASVYMADISSEYRWREYIESYVLRHPTEWVPATRDNAPAVFLRRSVLDDETSGVVEASASIQVRLPSYKILYDAGQEDVILRKRSEGEWSHLDERARFKTAERLNCLQKYASP